MKNNALIRIVVGSSLVLGTFAVGIGQAVSDDSTVTLIPPATVERGLTQSELWAEEQESLTDNGSTFVETYEDGSGVQYVNGMEVRTFPSNTFVWDCLAMGNFACGPTLPVTN